MTRVSKSAFIVVRLNVKILRSKPNKRALILMECATAATVMARVKTGRARGVGMVMVMA